MGVWKATSKRKIFAGPDRDETNSDKRNLAIYNVLFTHTGNYAAGGGTMSGTASENLTEVFQDIHCVIQCGVGPQGGGDVLNTWRLRTWQPIISSKNTVTFIGYDADDDAETDVGDIDDTIYCLVIGIPAVTVPSSVDSVDAFA